MKFKLTKLLSLCTKSYRKAIQLCVWTLVIPSQHTRLTSSQTLREIQQHIGWLDTCSRTVGNFGLGYAPLIQAYVQFIMSKLRFHRNHPEFNGLFEYAEYITLKGVDDPNEGFVSFSYPALPHSFTHLDMRQLPIL